MHTARHRVVQKRMPRHTHTRKINGRENSHVTDGHSKINHLLFMDDLKLYGRNDCKITGTVQIFSEDIGIQCGIEMCAAIKLQRGKVNHAEGIVIPNGECISDT